MRAARSAEARSSLRHRSAADRRARGRHAGLADFGKIEGNFYPRQIDRMLSTSHKQELRGTDAEWKVPPLPRLDELCAQFARRVPPDVVTLIHGDYKPDNIVWRHPQSAGTNPDTDAGVGGRPLRCAAVLDWELSTLGHPLSDLANLCLPYYADRFDVPIFTGFDPNDFATEEGQGAPPIERMLQWYCDASGGRFELAALREHWPFCVAFAFLRLAVILQGIAFRAAQGVASQAERGAVIGSFAGAAADAAWNTLDPSRVGGTSKL